MPQQQQQQRQLVLHLQHQQQQQQQEQMRQAVLLQRGISSSCSSSYRMMGWGKMRTRSSSSKGRATGGLLVTTGVR
jgi:hypothetical protein